ncbi:MAG: flavin reductase family protein, partial [Flavobacterium sp.]|nr:flavin reductase family protein [Flavobacterium sp.]
NWYSRAKEGLFEVEKPIASLGIGVDAIPDFVKDSPVFNGNDLGKLGNVETLPSLEEINTFVNQNVLVKGALSSTDEIKVHQMAKQYLDNSEPIAAWKILLAKRIE